MASRSWNRVELIGNLTRDPELRYTPNGAAVATFSIATNRTYMSEGERKEEVDFHRLVAWNKLAELCNQLLKKGMKVFVSGRLQTRSWEGQDGQTRQVTEIVVEDMIVLTPKNSSGFTAATIAGDTSVGPTKIEESESQKVKEPKDEEVKEEKASKPTEAPVEAESAVVPEKAPQEEVKDDLPF